MSALDLDALEGLCDAATPGPWKVEDEHTVMDLVGFCVAGTEWESDGAFIAAAREAVPALITRLRAAEARIERVGAILSDEGCDCYCDCDSDGHNADCDLCLACRIDREVSP